MSNITVVTPPDILVTNELSFLLIYPSNIIKTQFQDLLEEIDLDCVVYLYELDEVNEEPDWLLQMCHTAKFVILDVDNCPNKVRDLASYIIANTNTFYLTNAGDQYYNKLSVNRIFNLDFLKEKIGGYLEKKKQQ